MKNSIYIIIILVSFLTISCSEKIDIELNDDENSRLVVEGNITTQKTIHTIKLTRTTSYFANQPAPVESGAIVEIQEEGSPNAFVLNEAAPGIYQTDSVAGKVGKNYTLYIKQSNGEEFSATTYLDTVPEMDLIDYEYKEFPFHGNPVTFYILKLFAQEPEGKGNNYQFNIYLDGVWDNDTLREAVYDTDEFMDGMYLPGVDIYYIESDKLKKDTTRVRVDMLSIPYELLEYNVAVMLETDWRGSPFDGPPANIPTNISNGALGFFSASDISSFELDVILVDEE